jgi:phage tail sheath protein FI
MPFQVSPGVTTTERDLTTVVPNVSTSIGAIAGNFQWGPVLERTSITTENDLIKVFGKPNEDNFYDVLSAANYLAYSNNLVVVRNVGTLARNAVVGDDTVGTAGGDAIVLNTEDYDGTSFSGDNLFIAKYPGTQGNSLQVLCLDSAGWATVNATSTAEYKTQLKFTQTFNSAPGTSADALAVGGANDEMHVLIIDEDGSFTGAPGEILESFGYVSKASDAKRVDGSSNYIKNVLRNESKYVWLGNVAELTALSADAGGSIAGSVKTSTFKLINNAVAAKQYLGGSLLGGVSTAALTAAEYITGLDLFLNPEVVDITLLMAGGSSALATNTDAHSVGHKVNSIAASRKDCVGFVSPHIDSVVRTTGQTVKIKTDKGQMAASSYGIMDSSWKYQYDRYNDVFRYVPMNADMAGLCARTDFTNDAWWSPAGYSRGSVKNIVKLSWEATQADRDTLYKDGINSLTTPRGVGVILFGDKTMQTVPSAFDRINVRRLFIVLEKAIAIAAKSLLFEFNDEFTRAQFVNIVSPFLRDVQGRRGITDFKVVCDSSNNTGQVIDTNNFVGDIYVKPARSINFIQLNFIAARTDVSFSEIGG